MPDLTGRALCESLFDAGLLPYCHHSDDADVDEVDAREVRAEIERRGLVWEFYSTLFDILGLPKVAATSEQFWMFLNATPAQQCQAALKAVEGQP